MFYLIFYWFLLFSYYCFVFTTTLCAQIVRVKGDYGCYLQATSQQTSIILVLLDERMYEFAWFQLPNKRVQNHWVDPRDHYYHHKPSCIRTRWWGTIHPMAKLPWTEEGPWPSLNFQRSLSNICNKLINV